MRVLLVEDDNLIGTMVRLNLEQEGYKVDWQRNGEDGVIAAKDARFDVILLDIGLPGITGIAAAKQIRRASVGTPIVMLTARDDTQSKVSALDSGADDYLCKPFDMAELLARVRAQIRRSTGSLEVATDAELTMGQARIEIERRALQTPDGQWHELSDKEMVLLQFLAKTPAKP